jgi:hypothetical protein
LLYKQFQAEREKVLKHKWIESEKAGHVIGLELAMTDWILKHRSQCRKGQMMSARARGLARGDPQKRHAKGRGSTSPGD